MKRTFTMIIIFVLFMSFVSCENVSTNLPTMPFKQSNSQTTSPTKPMIFITQLSNIEIQSGDEFDIITQVINKGGSPATNLKLSLVGLPSSFEGRMNVEATGPITPLKNPQINMGESFTFEGLKFNKELSNPLEFSFYLKGEFTYSTKVATTLCANMNRMSGGCNPESVQDHYVSDGYLNIPPPTIQVLKDNKEEMQLLVTYNIRKNFNDVKFSKISDEEEEIKIQNVQLTPSGSFANIIKYIFSGKSTQTGTSPTETIIPLSYGTGTLSYYITIKKSKMTTTQSNFMLTFDIEYNPIELIPVSIKIIPKMSDDTSKGYGRSFI